LFVVKSNGCRVLVVDDDADSRDSLGELLESKGYTVAKSQHGAAAIDELTAGFDPDLILTDLMMPVMSGWELHDALKGRLAWRGIPIVVLCGMSSEQRGQLQVEDSFEKPTDFPVLLQRIASLCGI
jgi:CheY-like chemotaxis protein